MPITRIGEPALHALAAAPMLSTHSVFDATVNLRAGGRLIACTSRAVSAPHGVEMTLDDLRRLREARGPLRWDARRRGITEQTGAPLVDSAPWLTVFDPAVPAGGYPTVAPLVRFLIRRRPSTGFGADWPALIGDPRIAAAAASMAAARVDGAVRYWLGRGPGLTPSGDDILVGILATLCSTGILAGAAAAMLGQALASAASVRTHQISAEYLYYACRGMVAGPLHDLFDTLRDPHSAAVIDAVGRLFGYGHTSGADAVLGVVATSRWLSKTAVGGRAPQPAGHDDWL